MEHGNMLAIVGSPGSGKTTLAVKLAAEIAKKKKNVIVAHEKYFYHIFYIPS